MAENVLGTLFGDIADAIRGKTGGTETMKPADFPYEIKDIETGDSGITDMLNEINGEDVAEITVAKGSCGSAVTYVLKGSGVLTISGTGAITSAPWLDLEDFATAIEKVIINDGVTTICQHAFQSCTALYSATLSNTLTTINFGAFYDCGLRRITIPASVTGIYEYVFSNCDSLYGVTFEDTKGWTIQNATGDTSISLSSADAGNASLMAEYFTNYEDYYTSYRWLKS